MLRSLRILFVCNTVYQILVSMWIKYRLFPDASADILISDHMNDGDTITERMKETGLFKECIYVKTRAVTKTNIPEMFTPLNRLYPDRCLRKIVKLRGVYTHIFAGNLDSFTRLLYNAQSHKFLANPELILFEDGIGSYCSNILSWAGNTTHYYSPNIVKKILRNLIYRDKDLISSLKVVYAFEPEKIMWTPPATVKIPAIDRNDERFLHLINFVFAYDEKQFEYERKYIFLEESFFAENLPINDMELVTQLVEHVGKDNIIVKIHPRNKINRFAENGFLTNKNTSIPWEVIVMNMPDMSEKVLITIASSAAINPFRLLGINSRVYSLYNLVSENIKTSSFLTGDLWYLVKSYIEDPSNDMSMCNSIEDIH